MSYTKLIKLIIVFLFCFSFANAEVLVDSDVYKIDYANDETTLYSKITGLGSSQKVIIDYYFTFRLEGEWINVYTESITVDKNDTIYHKVDGIYPKGIFKLKTELKVIGGKDNTIVKTHPPKFISSYGTTKMPNLHLIAGVDSHLDFNGWFKVKNMSDNKVGFTNSLIKYKAGTQSFGYEFTHICNAFYTKGPNPNVSGNEMIKFCLNPNTEYEITAYIETKEGVKRGNPIKYKTGEFKVSKIKTIKPIPVTKTHATLNAELLLKAEYKVFFKLWEKRKNESNLPTPSIDLDLENIRLSTGEKYFSEEVKIEPNREYCYNSYIVSPHSKSVGSGGRICFSTYKNAETIQTPHYLQCNFSYWGGYVFEGGKTFCKGGCFDTSITMILAYWYKNSTSFKYNWEKKLAETYSTLKKWCSTRGNVYCKRHDIMKGFERRLGKMPNPYSSYWTAKTHGGYWTSTKVWDALNLKVIPIKTNEGKYIQDNYLSRGIPVLGYCAPSHASGRSNHFFVLQGFSKYDGYIKNGKKYINYALTNDSYYGENRILNVVNDYWRVKKYVNSSISKIPECGYQYGRYSKNIFAGGLAAIVVK